MSLLILVLCALFFSCAGVSAQDAVQQDAAGTTERELALPVPATYLALTRGGDSMFLYLEGETTAGVSAWGLRLSSSGQPLGPLRSIAPSMQGPLGAVFVTPELGLVVPTIVTETGEVTTFSVSVLGNDEEVTELLRCQLPKVAHGQVMLAPGQLLVVFEGPSGGLAGFATSADDPLCVPPERHVQLLEAPLPVGYLLGWLTDRMVVAGQTGDTYSLHFFDVAFRSLGSERLAAGSAVDPRDMSLLTHGEDGSLTAVFTASMDGARDIYSARFSEFSAASPVGLRIVATADAELAPTLVEHRGGLVVGWHVDQSLAGERLYLAGVVQDDNRALSGGEVIWRHSLGDQTPRASIWTDQGFLRAWAEGTHLRISLYQPSFWDL